MTKQEFHEIAVGHLKSIRDAFEEYIEQFPDSIRKGWDSQDHHLGMTIWNNHVSITDLVGSYIVSGEVHSIYLVDYRDDLGEYHIQDSPIYVEEFPNFSDLDPAPMNHKK